MNWKHSWASKKGFANGSEVPGNSRIKWEGIAKSLQENQQLSPETGRNRPCQSAHPDRAQPTANALEIETPQPTASRVSDGGAAAVPSVRIVRSRNMAAHVVDQAIVRVFQRPADRH
jgi:hypothetical protein